MRSSQSHDPGRGFGKLTRVDLGYFFCLLSMRLFQSYDPSHEFVRLTHVIVFVIFLISFFKIKLIGN
jgi:hypothetical protein